MTIFQEQCECTISGDMPTFQLAYPHRFVKRQLLLAFDLTRPGSGKEAFYFRDVWGLVWSLFGPMRNSQSNRMMCFNEWFVFYLYIS